MEGIGEPHLGTRATKPQLETKKQTGFGTLRTAGLYSPFMDGPLHSALVFALC